MKKQILGTLLVAAAIAVVVYVIMKDGLGKGLLVAGGLTLTGIVISFIVIGVIAYIILNRSRM
jgi:hypothetical protein